MHNRYNWVHMLQNDVDTEMLISTFLYHGRAGRLSMSYPSIVLVMGCSPGRVVPGALAMTAACTPSRASVHFSSAVYRFFSKACLEGNFSMHRAHTEAGNRLFVKLKPHGNLIDATLNPTLENETNEQFFYVTYLDIQLLLNSFESCYR
jgi:hypothetical protein